MKSIWYRNEIGRLIAVWFLSFVTVSWATAADKPNAVNQTVNSDSPTNTGKAFRYNPSGPNPYKGLSEKELWERKPTMKGGPHESPTEEQFERMKAWTRAMEDTALNPYAGKLAWQLRKMKPRVRKVGPWPPENEEEYHIWQWWHAIRKADPDQEWKMPIEFYGIVVNQSNQPLPGVSVSVIPSMVDGTTPNIHMETDANGRFSVTNIAGKCIGVIVGKIGYRPYLSAHQGFEYFDITLLHTPDPTNPVVFRLWEYSNPEPMYQSDVMSRRLPIDDKPVWVDVKGQVADTGHVGFSVLRVSPTNCFAGCTITIYAATGGGVKLAEADDELMFLAPAEGYQSKIRIEQVPGDVDSPGRKFRFYLRTSEQKYAALNIDINQYNDGTAGMHGLIYFNPSGSRNLQYRDDLRLRDNKKK